MTEEERKKANVAKQKRYLEKNRDKVNARAFRIVSCVQKLVFNIYLIRIINGLLIKTQLLLVGTRG